MSLTEKKRLLDDLFLSVELLGLSDDLTKVARQGQDALDLNRKSEVVVLMLVVAQRLTDSSTGSMKHHSEFVVRQTAHRISHLIQMKD